MKDISHVQPQTPATAFEHAVRRMLIQFANWTNLVFDGKAGTRLIAFELSPDGVLSDDEVDRLAQPNICSSWVDQSIAFRSLVRARAFVQTGEWAGTSEDLKSLSYTLRAVSSLFGAVLTDPYQYGAFTTDDVKLVNAIVVAFYARFDLSNKQPLTLKELAALAGLSEKTVRMAAIRSNRTPELVTYREGINTLVAAEECERWLATKRSFNATKILNKTDAQNCEPVTTLELASVLTQARERLGITENNVIGKLGLDDAAEKSYCNLESGWWDSRDVELSLFDVKTLRKLAEVLELPRQEPFVRAVSKLLMDYQIQHEFTDTEPQAKPSPKGTAS